MCRVLPPVVLLCVAIAGCGKRGGKRPPLRQWRPAAAGLGRVHGLPPTPTPQQKREYLFTIGRNSVGGPDDPANGPIFALVRKGHGRRHPGGSATTGFAFGLKLTSPKLTDAAIRACGTLPSLMYLSVGKARAVTANGVSELTRLKHLRVLELTASMPTTPGSPLKPLTEARRPGGCYQVTDAGLAHLAG